MKVAPLFHALNSHEGIRTRLIHTGQHHSDEMYLSLIRLFNLPDPGRINPLTSNAFQQKYEIAKVYLSRIAEVRPDVTVVVGDVTSSLVCGLLAKSMGIKLAHVEAGLRNFDLSMPEEFNRTMIDKVSDFHFTSSEDANENLVAEGISDTIHFVGNIMIDSYFLVKEQIDNSIILQELNLQHNKYALVTIHRQSNVDNQEVLQSLLGELERVSELIKLVIPIHPRTKSRIVEFGFQDFLSAKNICFLSPQSYTDFMKLLKFSEFVITDSGGVQEETTFFGIPCLTMRKDTERPITITRGTNRLVDVKNLQNEVNFILSKNTNVVNTSLDYWDGRTAQRIAGILTSLK